MNNYKNRRDRGQCVSCTSHALPESVRCQACREKHNEKWRLNGESINAKRREKAFEKSLERDKRLDEIDAELKREVAELLAQVE